MKKTISLETATLNFGKFLDQNSLEISGNSQGQFGILFDNGSTEKPGLAYSPENQEASGYSKGWNVRHSGSAFEAVNPYVFEPIIFTQSNIADGKVTILWSESESAPVAAPFGFGYSQEPTSVKFLKGKIELYYSSIESEAAVWFANSAQSMLV